MRYQTKEVTDLSCYSRLFDCDSTFWIQFMQVIVYISSSKLTFWLTCLTINPCSIVSATLTMWFLLLLSFLFKRCSWCSWYALRLFWAVSICCGCRFVCCAYYCYLLCTFVAFFESLWHYIVLVMFFVWAIASLLNQKLTLFHPRLMNLW